MTKKVQIYILIILIGSSSVPTNGVGEIVGTITPSIKNIAYSNLYFSNEKMYQLLPLNYSTHQIDLLVFSQIDHNPMEYNLQTNLTIDISLTDETIGPEVVHMAFFNEYLYFVFYKYENSIRSRLDSYMIQRYSLKLNLFDLAFNVTMDIDQYEHATLVPFDMKMSNDRIYILKGTHLNHNRTIEVFDINSQSLISSTRLENNTIPHGSILQMATDGSNVWLWAEKLGSITKPNELVNPKIFLVDFERKSMDMISEVDYSIYSEYNDIGSLKEVYYADGTIYSITLMGIISIIPIEPSDSSVSDLISETGDKNDKSNKNNSPFLQLGLVILVSITLLRKHSS